MVLFFFNPAPLTRGNDYLMITPAIGSPLHRRRTAKRASHCLIACLSPMARVPVPSMIYGYCTREKMLEWQSSRLAPLAPQFAVVVIIVRRWGRPRWACRNPTSVSKTEQGLTNRFPSPGCQNKQAPNLTRAPDNRLGMVGQRNGRIQKKVQNASIKLQRM